MKPFVVILFAFLLSFPSYGQNSNIYLYDIPRFDFVQQKTITANEYKKRYGRRFYNDVIYLSYIVTYKSKLPNSVIEDLDEEIAARQLAIEDRRSAWEAMRKENLKYRNAGIVTVCASLGVEAVTLPIIYKAQKKLVYHGEGGVITGEKKEPLVENKTRATCITTGVCTVGLISGIILLSHYRAKSYRYDPGFSLVKDLYIRDNGLGVSITKKF